MILLWLIVEILSCLDSEACLTSFFPTDELFFVYEKRLFLSDSLFLGTISRKRQIPVRLKRTFAKTQNLYPSLPINENQLFIFIFNV